MWFGETLPNNKVEEFDEDMRFPLKDLSSNSTCPAEEAHFRYNLGGIDQVSEFLGIPWNANKQQKRSYAVSLDVQNLIIQSHQPSTIHSRPSPLRILSYLAPSSISQHRQWPYHGWGCPDHFRILAVTKLDEMAGHCRRRVFVACRLKPSFFASHETRLVCLVGWTNIHLE